MPTTPARTLYLVAYDVADHKRLAQVHKYLTGWKVAGQKSFFECWMTPVERTQVMRELASLIDPADDRIHLFQLDPRMTPQCYGVAHSFTEGYFTIL